MKRKFYLILIFLLISFILLIACTKPANNNETTNGFIENSWYNNIILGKGENLYLEYPIYITKPFDCNLDISVHANENFINISSVNNILTDENEDRNKLETNLTTFIIADPISKDKIRNKHKIF